MADKSNKPDFPDTITWRVPSSRRRNNRPVEEEVIFFLVRMQWVVLSEEPEMTGLAGDDLLDLLSRVLERE